MSAFRVAVWAAMGVIACAAIEVGVGLDSVNSVLGGPVNPTLISGVFAVLVGLPIGALGLAVLLRRRRRLAWAILLMATASGTIGVGLGWSNQWPVTAAAAPSTVRFAGTAARPVDIAAGLAHACALMDDGTVWCWGSNTANQLGRAGDGSGPAMDANARPVSGLSGATAIASTDYATCAIANGRPVCWGGTPQSFTDCSFPADESSGCTGGVSEVPPAFYASPHSMGPLASDLRGQCDFAEPAGTCQPLPDVDHATSLTMAATHACVIDGGRVYCFGSDASGELGDGAMTVDANGRSLPGGAVRGIAGAETVVAGSRATCAVVREQAGTVARVMCWGGGAATDSGGAASGSPFEVTSSRQLAGMPLDLWHLCQVRAPAPDVCAGLPSVVMDPTAPSLNPVALTLPSPITDVSSGSAGTYSGCVVASAEVWCWGWDLGGATTLMDAMASPLATHLDGLRGATRVDTGAGFSCAVVDAAARCWGLASAGQLSVAASPGLADVLPGLALSLLVLAVAGAGFSAARMVMADTRRAALLAAMPERTLRLGTGAALRIALAAMVQVATIAFLLGQQGPRVADTYPIAVPIATIAAALVSVLLAVDGTGWRRRLRLGLAATGTAVIIGVGLAWWLPGLVGIAAGTEPQPLAAVPLSNSTLALWSALAAMAVLLIPPMDPAFARDFREAYRTAGGPRAQLSLLLHPWRVFAARAAETERKRLAAELHAEVLPGLYRSLRSVEAGGSVERLALDLRGAVEEVEGMLARRRSIVLEELGLLGALEWLAERTEERSATTVAIDVEDGSAAGDPDTRVRPPRTVERAAFRIAQLALENVDRHAPGAAVQIRIAVTPKRVAMRIADDGPGMGRSPGDAARDDGRRGLADMEQASRDCGGRLVVGPSRAGEDRPGVAIAFDWTG